MDVRVGSTKRHADAALIDELRRFVRRETYDEQPMPELEAAALDFPAAAACFAPVRALRPADLETLRLLTPHQGRPLPTVGGILLFGRDRTRHFPDAWIQAGRFHGTDRSHIAHRVETHSHLMTAACREAGLAPPTLEEIGTRFRVTLTTRPVTAPARDATDEAILAALADGEGRTTSQMGAAISLTPRTARTRLARRVDRGLLREVGTSPQDPTRRYFKAD